MEARIREIACRAPYHLTDDVFELIDIPAGGFSSDLYALLIFSASDEVHGVDHVVEGVMAGNNASEDRKTTQKG